MKGSWDALKELEHALYWYDGQRKVIAKYYDDDDESVDYEDEGWVFFTEDNKVFFGSNTPGGVDKIFEDAESFDEHCEIVRLEIDHGIHWHF